MLHITQTVAVHAVVPLLASWYFYSQPHYLALFFGLLELGPKETTLMVAMEESIRHKQVNRDRLTQQPLAS
jgi:hypothetical protein